MEWKPFKNFEKDYEICSTGEVRSIEKTHTCFGAKIKKPSKNLRRMYLMDGTAKVKLSKNGTLFSKTLSLEVYNHFCLNEGEIEVTDWRLIQYHDGDKNNVDFRNLYK